MNEINKSNFSNSDSFNGIQAESLSGLVKSYITRTFDEDLFCLVKFFPLEKDVVSCLCSKLVTSKTTGIFQDSETQRKLREIVFSTNAMPYRQPTSFISLLYNASKDFVLRILMFSGLVSLLLSFISDEDRRVEFIDGAAIFLTVLIVLLVSACNDYFKEKQFAALSDRSEKFCTVIRNSETYKINIEEILVGDVLFVEVGDEIPVDALVLQAQELQLDESSITGESDAIQKCTLEECLRCSQSMKDLDETEKGDTANLHHLVPSPIVLSGSIVMDGSGLLLVLAVGPYSQGGQVMNKLVVDTAPTSLQNKLNTLARDIGTIGFIAAVITLLVYVIQFWIHYKLDDDFSKSLSVKSIIDRHIKFLVQAITILVVAVPEGLPLAVTLSLAYSVRRMLQDQNYVRRLAACETMGSASEILLDKTGTLTMNRMTVEFIWSYALAKSNLKDAKEFLQEMDTLLTEKQALHLEKNNMNSFPFILIHSIALNSTANLEITQVKIPNGTETEHIKTLGSPTESALLLLLRDMKCDYNVIRKEYGSDHKIKHRVPFSSSRKIMTTVVTHPENPSLYRVYVKGGAELVLKLCQFLLESNGSIKSLTPPIRSWIERQVIQNMTCRGLRAVCLAYKDVDPSLHKFCFESFATNNALSHLKPSPKPLTLTVDDAFKYTDTLKNDTFVLEKGLVCLSMIGIRDMVREEVPAAVRLCQQAGVRVRMVTGDNIETAKQIAIKCHIYHPEQGGIALTGSEFYRRIGGVVCKQCRTEICDCPLTEVSTVKNKSGDKKFQLRFRKKTSLKNDVDVSKKVVKESKESNGLVSISNTPSKSVKEFVLRIGSGSNILDKKTVKKKEHFLSRLCRACKYYCTPLKENVTLNKTSIMTRVDEIGNMAEFESVANNLEVLARSQPQDKYAMVLGLKAMDCIVAVTGDGINDAPALKKADVGFAMGITGKEVAKQAADIVILDDNFESIVKAIKWGRSIYNNVRKFLLFQLTVNITAVSTAFIGSVFIGESPLTAVQLLWVNLIMDSFASLALGTEQATDDLLYKPHSRNEYLINRVMTRNIIGQIIYQLGVMFFLIFTGECWIPEQVSSYSQFEGKQNFSQFSKLCGNGRTVTPGRPFFFLSQKELYRRSWVQSIGPSRHYTIVFNTFVFLQVANLWNARKIDNEWNVFSGAFSSWLWWVVLGVISVTQTLLVHFGGQALRCHKDGLTAIQWLICLSFALGGLLVGFLLHFIPAEDLTFIPQAGKKETDILAKSTNVALASRGRFSSTRLSSRLAAGLHNESSHVYKTNRLKMMQSHRSSSSLTISPNISAVQSSRHF